MVYKIPPVSLAEHFRKIESLYPEGVGVKPDEIAPQGFAYQLRNLSSRRNMITSASNLHLLYVLQMGEGMAPIRYLLSIYQMFKPVPIQQLMHDTFDFHELEYIGAMNYDRSRGHMRWHRAEANFEQLESIVHEFSVPRSMPASFRYLDKF